MNRTESTVFKIAWLSLALIGVAILVFGLIVTLWPGTTNPLYLRAVGVACIGMGLFGITITLNAYRSRQHWAWFILWYYPIFWLGHLLGNLPPGEDHIHQIVFIILSLVGLLISANEFFPRSENGSS